MKSAALISTTISNPPSSFHTTGYSINAVVEAHRDRASCYGAVVRMKGPKMYFYLHHSCVAVTLT